MSCLKNFHFCKNQVHSQRQNQTAEPCFHQNPNPSAFGNRAALCGLVAMLFVFFAAFPVPGQTAAQKPTGRQTPAAIADGTAKIVSHADAAQMLRLVIGLKPPHPEEEQKFLDDLQDKTSPEFHHFLTADEWNARFGPSVEDERTVAEWAQSQGMTITNRYANRLLVDVEAPSTTIEKAFNVVINNYQLGTREFFSNDRDPVVPQGLSNIVESIGGLNNLNVLHPASKNAVEPNFSTYTAGPVHANGKSGSHSSSQKPPENILPNGLSPNITGGAYDPTDMFSSQAYDTNALYGFGHCCNPLGNPGVTPPETSIAIATAGTQNGSDFTGFHNQYPYLADHWQQFYIDGTPSCCDGEGTMDMEWSTAMSNSFGSFVDTAMIYIYDGVNANFSTFNDIYNHILNDGKARVFSTSWGCTELSCIGASDINTANNIFNQMVGQGWTLVAASGDQGATAGCSNTDAVQFPASSPNVVGAGGTTLSLASGPVFISEVAWSGGPDGCARNDGGSTGGLSAFFSTPGYQSSLGLSSRGVPDLALNADWFNTPQNIFSGGVLGGNGGTSIVAPELAGFFANENSYLLYLSSTISGGLCNHHSCAPLGNGNWYLYWFGENPGYAPHYPFYDVTSGCNNNNITALYGLGYHCAGTGYDLVTGWGSVNMFQLAWAINTYQAGDFGAPTAAFAGPPTGNWYNTDQLVTWNLTDTETDGLPVTGVSGFSRAWDSDPGDVFREATPGAGNSFYSGPQFHNAVSGSLNLASAGQGCHTLNLRAWDNTGFGSADLKYGALCYDTVAPISGESQAPLPDSFGWNKTAVKVSLSASDPGGTTGSGVTKIYYSVDNAACSSLNLGPCVVYSAAFNIATPAVHTVRFFSRDKAGNFSALNNAAVKIDETAPHTVATLTGTLNGTVYNSAVQVKLTVTDDLSGFGSAYYQLDGGAQHAYAGSFSVATVGSHTVAFHSIDRAGNMEATRSVAFTIKPKTTTAITTSVDPSVHGMPVTFTSTVTPALAGTNPGGKVVFKNGTTTIGTVALNVTTHKAAFTTSTLAVGTQSITAAYAGTVNFFPSTSGVVKQVVE